MMGMHPKASLLRQSLSSNVLGGMQLNDFIKQEDLEALEACVVVLLRAGISRKSLTLGVLQRETQRVRHDVCRKDTKVLCHTTEIKGNNA